ncbi:MAG: cysteine synthase family protein [Oscillospiraceae bacterium]|nr:cysteine synthase family protein [Oscillospiraceae bacterium]
MICDSILDAIGSTPLVRINRLAGPDCARILVKFEALNVGGSIKTRTAYGMITDAERRGVLRPGSVIVEPTSGNQGVGLALVAAVRGYEAVIIMPDSVSPERRRLVELYGARVVLVHDDGNIGDAIEQCLQTALRMQREDPRVWIPQQFINPANPEIQRNTTAREILEQAAGVKIDGFCSGIGTGGTLSGIGEALREANPDIVIWAVEPESAAILSGGSIGSHLQMGIGDGLIPGNLNTKIYDGIYVVTDADAIAAAKSLAREEGLACGITGGSNTVAALALAKKLGPGKTVVTLLPDTAERYYSTPLFD